MPGPAPKPADQRARRNKSIAMTTLPAEGRKGRAPAWPLGPDVKLATEIELQKLQIGGAKEELDWASNARERTACRKRIERLTKRLRELEAMEKGASALEVDIWKQLWKTPQASQWEKRRWYREVALYARHQAKAECGSMADSAEARMREDRLGLNDLAMLRLRWEIGATTTAKPGTASRTGSRRSSYGGLRVVAE